MSGAPAAGPQTPLVLVVMGVSGSGKTTVGRRLAERLGYAFCEGDDLHPPANVEKMRNGHPLTDADRWPWLARVAERIDAWRAAGQGGVIACSALKRAYRAVIIGDRPGVRLVYLKGDDPLIRRRMKERRGHFMPVGLLTSQFADLEPPGPGERPITVGIEASPDDTVSEIIRQLAGGA